MFIKSDHCDGTCFFNTEEPARENPSLLSVFKWKAFEPCATWPTHIDNSFIPKLPDEVAEGEAFITLINHATELIQISGLNLLTDPIFSQRASPFSWIGPKRIRSPALAIEALPKIDVVLISHNHYDHMDIPSLELLEETNHPLYIVPLGNKKILESLGIKNIVELDWWEEYRLDTNTSIVMAPAQHWSGRGLFDRMKTLWGSYIILSEKMKLFFAGDTGYSNHFHEVKRRYGKIDISILPIGAYEPRWFMKQHHMSPEEAVQAYLDLGSHWGLGMHYETFQLTNESIDDPVTTLHNHLEKITDIQPGSFKAQISGETIYYNTLTRTSKPISATPL